MSNRLLVGAHAAGSSMQASFGILDDQLPDWDLAGPDYPGTLSRPATVPPTLEELADLVVATGAATGCDRFPILGQSLGSAVAIMAAARHPDTVTALVLTVGFTRLDQHGHDFMTTWQRLHDAHDRPALARHLLGGVTTADQLATMPPTAQQVLTDRLLTADAAGGHLHAGLAADLDVTVQAQGLRIPVLVISADQDQIITPTVADWLAEAIPSAQHHHIHGAGHAFGPLQATEWARAIRDFLRTE